MDYDEQLDKIIDIANGIDFKAVTVLTGRNAGGKSLVRKLLHHSLDKELGRRGRVVHASQEIRTAVNPNRMGMTHDLEWLATSRCTIHVIEQVFNQREADYIVIDEPEIGIGEELQLGLVDWLNEKIEGAGRGVLVTTHSRVVVRGLKFDRFINLEGMSREEWLGRTAEKISVKDFLEFAEGLRLAVIRRQREG